MYSSINLGKKVKSVGSEKKVRTKEVLKCHEKRAL